MHYVLGAPSHPQTQAKSSDGIRRSFVGIFRDLACGADGCAMASILRRRRCRSVLREA